MLKLLDDIDYSALDKDVPSIEEERKQELADTVTAILVQEKLRNRYRRVIEGDAEPSEEDIDCYRKTGAKLKELQSRKEDLERAISNAAVPKLDKIVTIHCRTWKERNLFLKDEIRKRVAQIVLTFNAHVLSAPDPNRRIAGIQPGKGKIVAKIFFTNGAVKLAIIDGLNAALLW